MAASKYAYLKGEKTKAFLENNGGSSRRFIKDQSNIVAYASYRNNPTKEYELPNKGMFERKTQETPFEFAERLIIAPCQINKAEWVGKMYYWLISEFRLTMWSSENESYIEFFKLSFPIVENKICPKYHLYKDFEKSLPIDIREQALKFAHDSLTALCKLILTHAHPIKSDAIASFIGFVPKKMSAPTKSPAEKWAIIADKLDLKTAKFVKIEGGNVWISLPDLSTYEKLESEEFLPKLRKEFEAEFPKEKLQYSIAQAEYPSEKDYSQNLSAHAASMASKMKGGGQ